MTTREYHPTHEMVRDQYGVDIWRYEVGSHNGPECLRCGKWCHHCDSDRAKRPCENEREYGVADYVVCAICAHWAVAHGVTHPGLVPCECCGRTEPSWKPPVDNATARPAGNAGSGTAGDQ